MSQLPPTNKASQPQTTIELQTPQLSKDEFYSHSRVTSVKPETGNRVNSPGKQWQALCCGLRDDEQVVWNAEAKQFEVQPIDQHSHPTGSLPDHVKNAYKSIDAHNPNSNNILLKARTTVALAASALDTGDPGAARKAIVKLMDFTKLVDSDRGILTQHMLPKGGRVFSPIATAQGLKDSAYSDVNVSISKPVTKASLEHGARATIREKFGDDFASDAGIDDRPLGDLIKPSNADQKQAVLHAVRNRFPGLGSDVQKALAETMSREIVEYGNNYLQLNEAFQATALEVAKVHDNFGAEGVRLLLTTGNENTLMPRAFQDFVNPTVEEGRSLVTNAVKNYLRDEALARAVAEREIETSCSIASLVDAVKKYDLVTLKEEIDKLKSNRQDLSDTSNKNTDELDIRIKQYSESYANVSKTLKELEAQIRDSGQMSTVT